MPSPGEDHAQHPQDPFRQKLLLEIPGMGKIPISITDISHYAQYGIRICINYASQIGASFVLLVVLLLLTRPDKRWTPVFTLNVITLAINGVRSVLQCLYFTSGFYNPYAFFSGDFQRVPLKDYQISIAAVLLTSFVVVFIELSLMLQVQAVCADMRSLHRNIVYGVAGGLALVAIGFRFALAILNSIAIANAQPFGGFQWLAASSLYLITASVCLFSLIFVTKLGLAIRKREKLGIKRFGPMQIVFIMGCQTMLIPAIFSVLQNFTDAPELGSLSLTLVVLFLPLSAMWASQSMTGPASLSKSSQRRLAQDTESQSTNDTMEKKHFGTPTTASTASPAPRYSLSRPSGDGTGKGLQLQRDF